MLNRVADALGEVARLSPLHSWFAAQVLQGFLGSLDKLPRDAHHVLALLLELLTDLGLALDEAGRRCLESVKGSSKTAKSARSLLALAPSDVSVKVRHAQSQLLEARIARAERWSRTF